jgi:heme exporter protein CcmD
LKGLHEYLHMGGDGVFIWSAYLIATILLAGISMAIILRNRKVKKRMKVLEATGGMKGRRSEADGNA